MSSMKRYIPGFTILEVTVVLAIMSVLITIITGSVNRFNEQLKVSGEIHQELNHWYAFRSSLWKELYLADSVLQKEQSIFIYNDQKEIRYRMENDVLMRSVNEANWTSVKIGVESLKLEKKEEGTFVIFDVLWKGEAMRINYYFKPDLKTEINSYFEHLK